MKEHVQAGNFYRSLAPEEKEEMCQVLAEDIFFLEEGLRKRILALLEKTDPELGQEISKRNTFTTI